MDKLRTLLLEKFPILNERYFMYPKETLIDYVLKGQFFVVCKTYRLQDIMEQMVLWCAIHPEISETVSRLVRDLAQEFYNANINE